MSQSNTPEHLQTPEVMNATASDAVDAEAQNLTESVIAPAKVMRIGSMVKQLLDELKGTPLDEASRERLAEIYERSVAEVASALSPDLAEELHTL